MALYSGGKYYYGEKKSKKFDSPGKWISFSTELALPKAKSMVFYMRITGDMDIDDLRVTPVEEEEMPDSSKH